MRILYNVFAALIIGLLASCGGEDDGDVDLEIPQNSVQYDGMIYNLDFGLLTNQSKTDEFIADADTDDVSLADANFFTSGYVALSATDGEEVNVSGGIVVLSGEEPDYTIEYDLQLENGSTLRGTYLGSFVDGKINGR